MRALAAVLCVASLAPGPVAAERWLRAMQSFHASAEAGGALAASSFDSQALAAQALLARVDFGVLKAEFRFEHAYVEYDFEPPPSINLDPHDLRFALLAQRPLGGGTLLARFAPGFAVSSNVVSDIDFGREDFSLDAALAWRRPRSATSAWLVGAAVDRRFGRTAAYPLLGLEFRPNPRLTLAAVLPEPWLVHEPAARLWWGMSLAPAGNRWRIFDAARERHFALRARGWRGTAEVWRAVHPGLWAGAAIGIDWGRKLEFQSLGGAALTARPASAWHVSIGLAIGALPARVGVSRW